MHGVEPVAEDSGSRGRADMAIRVGGRVYLFEFKVVERGREGTAQLREKGYADKYRHLGRSVHLVEFSRAERNVVGLRDRLKPGLFPVRTQAEPRRHLPAASRARPALGRMPRASAKRRYLGESRLGQPDLPGLSEFGRLRGRPRLPPRLRLDRRHLGATGRHRVPISRKPASAIDSRAASCDPPAVIDHEAAR